MHAGQVNPVIDPSVRGVCTRPYPNHPKGCPNWNKREDCPPKAPMLGELVDLRRPVYLVWNAFDFGAHVAKMRARHPEWSDRQVECCLYWQGTARKRLRAKVRDFLEANPGTIALHCPEACGVDVTGTMATLGVELEWPPKTVAYQVALAGYPKEGG